MKSRYNALVDSEELRSEISTTHLQNLAEIFVKYNVHERLGVHLIHGYVKVAAGNVMLGHTFTEPSGRWAKPMTMEEVNLEDVHGHIFKLVDGGHFVAYEYVEGKANDLSDISTYFFKDLVEYLKSHQLEATVGLQILGPSAGNMATQHILSTSRTYEHSSRSARAQLRPSKAFACIAIRLPKNQARPTLRVHTSSTWTKMPRLPSVIERQSTNHNQACHNVSRGRLTYSLMRLVMKNEQLYRKWLR
jgi:hypothetical protein